MRMIEAAKVPPLIRLLLMKHPYADDIMEQMQYLIDEQTIDAVPVVRCEKCKHTFGCKKGFVLCKRGWMPNDGFCSYGDRKGGDT